MVIGIIGAGASGMAAALAAATNPDVQVILMERQARVGRKLSATGNGRCNLTNLHAMEGGFHGEDASFASFALKHFGVNTTLDWFRQMGLFTVSAESGLLTPRMKGTLADMRHWCGVDMDTLRRRRGELLNATAEDLLTCREFEDSVAVGCYSVDIHSPDGSGTTIKKIPAGKWYHIPYRALLPEGADNLLVAGRCISSTHEAQSAYRVLPIVANIGEAAGLAAALAKKEGATLADVPMDMLHTLLDESNLLY